MDQHSSPSDATVRISAVALESGSTQVALQVQDDSGRWGARQVPTASIVPAGAQTGQWLNSSELSVPTHWPGLAGFGETRSAGGTEGLFRPHPGIASLNCVIGHGDPIQDTFWAVVEAATTTAAYIHRQNTRFVSSPDGAAQAAAIRECVADGATAIAATLGNIDAVGDALREASNAGVHIFTYNSGVNEAASVNSAMHIAVDEVRGGQIVGERLNAAGTTGDVWCVIHEAANVGLEERCDGLEGAYAGGTVTRVRIDDEAGRSAAEARIAEGGISAILTLNSDSAHWAVEQAQASGHGDITIATFGADPQLLSSVFGGALQFVVWDQPILQGYLIESALRLGFVTFTGQPLLELGGAKLIIEPVVYDVPIMIGFLQALSPDSLAILLSVTGLSAEAYQLFIETMGSQ